MCDLQLWLQVATRLRAELAEAVWTMWFGNVRALRVENGQLVLGVPSSLALERIRSSYGGLLIDTLRDTTGEEMGIDLEIDTAPRPDEPVVAPRGPGARVILVQSQIPKQRCPVCRPARGARRQVPRVGARCRSPGRYPSPRQWCPAACRSGARRSSSESARARGSSGLPARAGRSRLAARGRCRTTWSIPPRPARRVDVLRPAATTRPRCAHWL